jgi:sugar transferase (PEP-CTERM/EpsH1 system associated)
MSSRPNILYLVHRVPYPPNRGDRIRSYHLLRHLARGANVYLATLADEPLEPGTEAALSQLCRRVAIEPVSQQRWLRAAGSVLLGRSATAGLFASPQLRQTVDRWAEETRFEAVVVFCSSMAGYLEAPGLRGVPVLADLVDVDSQKFADYAAKGSGPKAWLYRWEGARLRQVERRLCQRSAAITLVSEAEAELFRHSCPNDKTIAVKNGVDLEFFSPVDQAPQSKRCVFIGALDYPPNIDGIGWFCNEVWPHLRATHPGATLAIVGRQPVPAVRRLDAIPGVEVIGSVPDVRPHVAAASVAVVPLRIARGIQNKVLEALAMAKPVIASPSALEGLEVTAGEHVLSAVSVSDWISSLEMLFRDSRFGAQLGEAGREFVETHHSWQACLSPLDPLLGLRPAPSEAPAAEVVA